jgi:hypothetical protein
VQSPLASPPLKRIGRWTARKVHGDRRSAQGYLLTRSHYLDEAQEWRVGQGYLGMLALPVFPLVFLYVQTVHVRTGYWVGRRHVLGHWSDLPADLKILIPLLFAAQLIGLLSAARTLLIWRGAGSRDELGE